MSFAKGSALVVAFVGAVALGVLIGPYITDRSATVTETVASSNPAPAPSVEKDQTARSAQGAPAGHGASAKAMKTPVASAVVSEPDATTKTIPAAAPALHERMKKVLNKGADMGIASEDFGTAEQFVAVAQAARNTKVPFMVLKQRVVYEGKSLEDAIHEFKPDLNAADEAQRARVEAQSVISELEG
jgi:hypothetical protein